MESKTHFNFLLEYNNWANNNFAIVLKKNNVIKGKPLELFSHIVNAEIMCIGRVNKDFNYPFQPFDVRDSDSNINLLKSNNLKWKDFINSLQEYNFDNLIEYKNVKNENCILKIWEIIIHMINHSTYHRGQIASLLKGMNIQPPVSGFAEFVKYKK
jgi:uncharacterized damage-inducible protein DinB